ncbi:cytochrome c biogenesis heme-transporting ATPase CcmA [Aliikangiella maris]|uniref:Cytochrome c biogenesis heme-transporting ATPase CcmA n=2 Tax=Aliikangiella maris TaxID=3162458 RepID=A0ABV2BUU3_9GAMM
MASLEQQYSLKNQLSITDLSVFRSETPIFSPVSFTLSAGECIQVRGHNGAGKTTLLRAVCGLNQNFEGQICWNGESIFKQSADYYQSLLYIGHHLGLKPKLTAEQNLNFYRKLRFPADKTSILNALSQFGIGDYFDETVAYMSAGQKRRVALSRILTEPVPFWILDEPMVALDIDGQKSLEGHCNQHLNKGGMLLITSHQPISGIQNLQEVTLT